MPFSLIRMAGHPFIEICRGARRHGGGIDREDDLTAQGVNLNPHDRAAGCDHAFNGSGEIALPESRGSPRHQSAGSWLIAARSAIGLAFLAPLFFFSSAHSLSQN